MTLLVVIQGAPAVGKTTLANKIAQGLSIGIVAKDDVKELLYDKVGLPVDRDQSRVYGTAVMKSLFILSQTLLEGGVSHILESAFHPELANRDFEQLMGVPDVRIIQLYCFTDPSIQAKRYRERLENGTRHKGHPDLPKEKEEFIDLNEQYTKLSIEPTIDIDTTHFTDADVEMLVAKIKKEWGNDHETSY